MPPISDFPGCSERRKNRTRAENGARDLCLATKWNAPTLIFIQSNTLESLPVNQFSVLPEFGAPFDRFPLVRNQFSEGGNRFAHTAQPPGNRRATEVQEKYRHRRSHDHGHQKRLSIQRQIVD